MAGSKIKPQFERSVGTDVVLLGTVPAGTRTTSSVLPLTPRAGSTCQGSRIARVATRMSTHTSRIFHPAGSRCRSEFPG